MNKRLLLIIAITFLVIVGIGFVLIITDILPLSFLGKKEEITTLLGEADTHIHHEKIGEAKRIIKQSLALARSERDFISILDRGWSITQMEEDYEFFYEITEKAREILPGNDLLIALNSLAASRSGRFEEALETAESLPKEYQNIIGEVYFRDFTTASLPEELENGDITLLIAAQKRNDPSEFEEVARTFNSEEFWLDALLLWTKEGNFKRAFTLFEEHLRREDYPLLYYLLAIQIKDFKAAEKALATLIKNNPEDFNLQLRKADLFLKQGKVDAAVAMYLSLLERDPGASIIPYINTAWYLIEQDRPKEGEEILLKGIKQFPSSEVLILSLMEFYTEQGSSERARNFLLQETIDIQSPTLKALKWNLVDAENNPQRLHSLLWELVNEYPYNKNLAQFFAWRLIGFGSTEDFELLLSRFIAKNGEMEWTHFLRGVYLGTKGYYAESLKELEKAQERLERYVTFFNLGLIAKAKGDIDRAVYFFQNCETALLSKNGLGSEKGDLVTTHVELSEVHFQMGNTEKSLRHVELALEIEPENLNALIIKKRIEESRNGTSE